MEGGLLWLVFGWARAARRGAAPTPAATGPAPTHAKSYAQLRASCTSAPFIVAYVAQLGCAKNEEMDPWNTMEAPAPGSPFMWGSACLVSSAWPLMFTAAERSQSSALAVSTLWNTNSAALFTSTWMAGPKRATVAATAAAHSASFSMSADTHSECAATYSADAPRTWDISPTVSAHGERDSITTLAPSSKKRTAIACPKPREAPDTMHVCPSSRGSVDLARGRRSGTRGRCEGGGGGGSAFSVRRAIK